MNSSVSSTTVSATTTDGHPSFDPAAPVFASMELFTDFPGTETHYHAICRKMGVRHTASHTQYKFYRGSCWFSNDGGRQWTHLLSGNREATAIVDIVSRRAPFQRGSPDAAAAAAAAVPPLLSLHRVTAPGTRDAHIADLEDALAAARAHEEEVTGRMRALEEKFRTLVPALHDRVATLETEAADARADAAAARGETAAARAELTSVRAAATAAERRIAELEAALAAARRENHDLHGRAGDLTTEVDSARKATAAATADADAARKELAALKATAAAAATEADRRIAELGAALTAAHQENDGLRGRMSDLVDQVAAAERAAAEARRDAAEARRDAEAATRTASAVVEAAERVKADALTRAADAERGAATARGAAAAARRETDAARAETAAAADAAAAARHETSEARAALERAMAEKATAKAASDTAAVALARLTADQEGLLAESDRMMDELAALRGALAESEARDALRLLVIEDIARRELALDEREDRLIAQEGVATELLQRLLAESNATIVSLQAQLERLQATVATSATEAAALRTEKVAISRELDTARSINADLLVKLASKRGVHAETQTTSVGHASAATACDPEAFTPPRPHSPPAAAAAAAPAAPVISVPAAVSAALTGAKSKDAVELSGNSYTAWIVNLILLKTSYQISYKTINSKKTPCVTFTFPSPEDFPEEIRDIIRTVLGEEPSLEFNPTTKRNKSNDCYGVLIDRLHGIATDLYKPLLHPEGMQRNGAKKTAEERHSSLLNIRLYDFERFLAGKSPDDITQATVLDYLMGVFPTLGAPILGLREPGSPAVTGTPLRSSARIEDLMYLFLTKTPAPKPCKLNKTSWQARPGVYPFIEATK